MMLSCLSMWLNKKYMPIIYSARSCISIFVFGTLWIVCWTWLNHNNMCKASHSPCKRHGHFQTRRQVLQSVFFLFVLLLLVVAVVDNIVAPLCSTPWTIFIDHQLDGVQLRNGTETSEQSFHPSQIRMASQINYVYRVHHIKSVLHIASNHDGHSNICVSHAILTDLV